MHACGCVSDLLGAGVDAADDILRSVYAIDIMKALDPLKDRDFVTIVNTLAKQLDKKTNPPSRAIVTRAIQTLDVDWVNITPAQQGRIVDAANTVLTGLVPARFEAVPLLEAHAKDYVKNVRDAAVRKFRLDVPSFTTRDQGVARGVVNSTGNFITDATGALVEDLTTWTRATASEMLEAGLSSSEIASALGSGLEARALGKAANYWRVVAMSYANRARTWEQLSTYADAKIEVYVWESVMDERTTEICRFMDGARFQTDEALRRFQAGDDEVGKRGPQGLKDTQPWVTQTRNQETGKRELVIRTSKGQTTIAVVEEPGFGEVDRRGTYSNALDLPTLAELGVSAPPVHGLCRSTIVADV